MTSRRDFLGVLAAAPFVAPAFVQPRYASGGTFRLSGMAAGIVGEDCHGGFVLSPSQSRAFLAAMDQPMTKLGTLNILMRSPSPWDAPNRLYGAYINDDGDAV